MGDATGGMLGRNPIAQQGPAQPAPEPEKVAFQDADEEKGEVLYTRDVKHRGEFTIREITQQQGIDMIASRRAIMVDHGVADSETAEETFERLSDEEWEAFQAALREHNNVAWGLHRFIVKWTSERAITPETCRALPNETKRVLWKAIRGLDDEVTAFS